MAATRYSNSVPAPPLAAGDTALFFVITPAHNEDLEHSMWPHDSPMPVMSPATLMGPV
jgi:hypothetical protein